MIFNIQKETPFGVSFLKNSLKDYKPQVRFVIFNGINEKRCKNVNEIKKQNKCVNVSNVASHTTDDVNSIIDR